MNRFTLLLPVFLCVILPAQEAVPPKPAPTGLLPAHIRLTWHTEPQHRAIVSWSTREAGQTHSVVLSERHHPNASERRIAAQDNGRLSAERVQLYYHHVRLDQLKANTEYDLRIQSDEEQSPTYWFRTAPVSADRMLFLSGGDSRSDPAMRRRMNVVMRDLVKTRSSCLS